MEIKADKIKELRDATGISVAKCKEALEAASGDFEKAVLELREQGNKGILNKSSRETREGIIVSYVHTNKKVGVLLKLYCETDFVAKNEEFQELARDLAMQVAAMNPEFLRAKEVPEEILKKERELEEKALKEEKKPADIKKKIIRGKLEKFKEESSLLTQSFIKNPEITVNDLIKEKINKLGENIKVGDFVRYEI